MRYIRYALMCVRLNIASAMQYRSSFLMQAFGMALSNSSFIFFWWMAFSQLGGDIAGYSFNDMMFVWASAASAFGLAYIIFGGMTAIDSAIISSELDTYLLQPKPALLSMLCSRSSLSAWGDFFYGIILLLLTNREPGAIGFFCVAVVCGGLLLTAVNVAARSLTFYFGSSSTLGMLAGEMMLNFSLYPAGIFKGFARVLMYTVLPAAFVNHVPLELSKSFSIRTLLVLFIAVVLYCALACWVFSQGLKRYESGNLIVTKM